MNNEVYHYQSNYVRTLQDKIKILDLCLSEALYELNRALEITRITYENGSKHKIVIIENPITRSYILKVDNAHNR